MIEAFYADSKKEEKEEKKKPVDKNKNPMLLISCQHNQKSPFLLFPLKSPSVLIMRLSLERLGPCFASVRLICSCEGPVFIVSPETG